MEISWKHWEVDEAAHIARIDHSRKNETATEAYDRRWAKLLSQGDTKGISHLIRNTERSARFA